ncbi:hypothetical protein BU25DRAFT_224969 [Macroventuria anomochaeta]|uniref:Uncharacterized protein n=1 Tax=Macroventuria anomochaeta TaxID=301207 RepID=A0ACB6SCV5_9PLEO|nr:uncharacterized protein BU25DRAFT_224969 [Macroventuria anomochaeta]KAF2631139.1 hypothetical protein BU25DRAFT_224969 [Macroventuria anomochaeta]
MTAEHMAARQTFKDNFLRLPREMRDLIYVELYSDSSLIPLEDVQVGLAGPALLATENQKLDPILAPEILEAFFTHSTFSVTFPPCSIILPDPCDVIHSRPADWNLHPHYGKYIRKLVVHAEEANLDETISLEALESECSKEWRPIRVHWERLLKLPRLEQLNIRLQKRANEHFCWGDFSPILIRLRERLPKLQIALSISFDTMLEEFWSDAIWENNTEPGNVVEEPYDPMGFVDVTELIEPPTEEDTAYVQENLSGNLETWGQDILRGLLDETAPQKRALALHYAVKEPALLRVRMKEHYEVYKRMRTAEADDST